jgi:small conductance mechanosensitive channel
MIFKPFKVDDLVTIGGDNTGTVEAINAFNTTLRTLDNKKIIIANSNVTDNTITNISGQGTAGVELTFGIGYDDNIDKARDIILKVGKECPHILDDPAHGVVVAELGDSSVNLATRPFCKSENYWDTRFFMIENVKKEFDKAGIGIPFPQMDLHIKEHQKN